MSDSNHLIQFKGMRDIFERHGTRTREQFLFAAIELLYPEKQHYLLDLCEKHYNGILFEEAFGPAKSICACRKKQKS